MVRYETYQGEPMELICRGLYEAEQNLDDQHNSQTKSRAASHAAQIPATFCLLYTFLLPLLTSYTATSSPVTSFRNL